MTIEIGWTEKSRLTGKSVEKSKVLHPGEKIPVTYRLTDYIGFENDTPDCRAAHVLSDDELALNQEIVLSGFEGFVDQVLNWMTPAKKRRDYLPISSPTNHVPILDNNQTNEPRIFTREEINKLNTDGQFTLLNGPEITITWY